MPDHAPMILYCTALTVALALCVVPPVSSSAKEPRSAAVKREFQLTHPCPATGRTSGACPGYVKDHVPPSPVAVLMRSLTSSGRLSTMRRQRINGRRRAALGRRETTIPRWVRRVLPYADGTLTSFNSAAAVDMDNMEVVVD